MEKEKEDCTGKALNDAELEETSGGYHMMPDGTFIGVVQCCGMHIPAQPHGVTRCPICKKVLLGY